jgi:malate dehydrogenase (oxaloacetate-decarboxylating)(NADP+)
MNNIPHAENTPSQQKVEKLYADALRYHAQTPAGKLAIKPTKTLTNQRDLALAYSPGVAAPCEAIQNDPDASYIYTNRSNLVAVISNGTAVLGLGDIGPLASKPVMEGKAVLFKKFSNIDVFDLEVNEKDPDKLVEIIAALAPTFGGINLEDIKAPDCFYIEHKLRERLQIPVFHDDQHGTAIVVGAAFLNALKVVNKSIKEIKLVVSGAGAAALACLNLLLKLGLPRHNVWVCDLAGLVYQGRVELMDETKAKFAQATNMRTLEEVIDGADVFLGLSAGGVLKPAMVKKMQAKPIIFALANPKPEILPAEVKAVRDDAVIATGRSDYPNQVNNVLCFPYIFRGALDSGACAITKEMEIAAVHAIAKLAQQEANDKVTAAYAGEEYGFGPNYLIPKPFDPRLMTVIAPAVAQAAAESGVARRPVTDMASYQENLQSLVYASGTIMKPIYYAAKRADNRRIAYAEGEDERVLHAAQVIVDESLAYPVLIGCPHVIHQRIHRLGLRLTEGKDYEMVNTDEDPRYRELWQEYHRLGERKGITAEIARVEMRRRLSLIGAMLLKRGDVDGLICGVWGNTPWHLHYIDRVIGKRQADVAKEVKEASVYATMNVLILPERQLFLVDTHINQDPSAEALAEITEMAATAILRFGIKPKAALISHSNFGSSKHPSALKMQQVLKIVHEQTPWLAIDGEMHGDLALDSKLRKDLMPNTSLEGDANLLILPNLDAANIAYNLLKTAAGNGIAIGPILLGANAPVHILTASTTVRRIVNMTALTVAEVNVGQAAKPE